MKKLLTGNEAIARGAYEAGVRVATAYPGTPSTEILENVARYPEIRSQWSPNEKVALEVGIGASVGGARTLVAMKHVGVNVAADPLMTLAYTGVGAGLVLVSADDPGMHSSQNEQDNRFFGRFAQIPVLEPSDSQEVLEFLGEAYRISEEFDTPVLFRETTRIAHSQSLVELGGREEVPVRPYEKDPAKYVMLPANARKRHPVVEERRRKLEAFSETTDLNRIEWRERKLGIVTSGATYQYVREVLPEASILKLGLVWPVPRDLVETLAAGVEELLVVEELEPFFEETIRSWGIPVRGRDLFPGIGELSPRIIGEALGIPAPEGAIEPGGDLPVRPPVMCPGCPHRGVFYVFQKMKLRVSGDIGCYTLGAAPPLSAMDTCVCMGASIPMAHGMELAGGREAAARTVAVIGDSTFMHSGMTGLIDVVYNRGSATVVILDNATTAMTGHQENPSTGQTLSQGPAGPIDMAALCRGLGVARVRELDPYDLAAVEAALKEEIAAEECSVLLFRRPCVLLPECAPQGTPVRVDHEVCTGCGTCKKLGCPAIVFRGKKPETDGALCNGCGLCVSVCPFKAFQEVGQDD